ncbi:hypothetical protein GCM10022381_03430 [Leifsonia kafniensis]|uniref:Cardiolipin synthase N-terminal domain-containing protein n=1 Tax=Leifsonia kafniensis TaxID=475957 RepID=A0ABP7K2B4_9MICO
MFAIAVVSFMLVLGALIDIILRQDGQVKHLPKTMWILLVIFLPLIGSILWFTIGREYTAPVDRGGFGDPRRREKPRPEYAAPPRRNGKTTEDELAELDREIEFHTEQARLRQLHADLEERRRTSE